jgi:hypothetical protein
MMPHPTMKFAWDEDVQRCSSRLLGAFLIAVFALFAASLLFGHTQDLTPVVAEQHAVIPDEDALLYIELQDGPLGR